MELRMPMVAGLAGLISIAAGGCNFSTSFGSAKAKRTENFTIPVPPSGKCVIRARNGQIRCIAADVLEIGVEAEITARASTLEEAEQLAEQITIERAESEGVAEIAANFPSGANGGVSMTVTLPATSSLDLKSSNGAIEVTKVTGGITAETSNGPIRLVDCSGQLDVQSSNGKLLLRGDSLANIKAKTSNGSVELEGSLSPGRHQIQTSNGSITAALSGTPVEVTAKTSNGQITANGRKVGKGEKTALGTLDGDIAELSLSTSNGSVTITHSQRAESKAPAAQPL